MKHDANRYKNHGCRCETCTRANTEYSRDYRARLDPLPAKDPLHGTYYAYVAFGCRCNKCRDANRRQQLRRRYFRPDTRTP